MGLRRTPSPPVCQPDAGGGLCQPLGEQPQKPKVVVICPLCSRPGPVRVCSPRRATAPWGLRSLACRRALPTCLASCPSDSGGEAWGLRRDSPSPGRPAQVWVLACPPSAARDWCGSQEA